MKNNVLKAGKQFNPLRGCGRALSSAVPRVALRRGLSTLDAFRHPIAIAKHSVRILPAGAFISIEKYAPPPLFGGVSGLRRTKRKPGGQLQIARCSERQYNCLQRDRFAKLPLNGAQNVI
jgi:hypothetical protein